MINEQLHQVWLAAYNNMENKPEFNSEEEYATSVVKAYKECFKDENKTSDCVGLTDVERGFMETQARLRDEDSKRIFQLMKRVHELEEKKS